MARISEFYKNGYIFFILARDGGRQTADVAFMRRTGIYDSTGKDFHPVTAMSDAESEFIHPFNENACCDV
jgi:hypothetical protein